MNKSVVIEWYDDINPSSYLLCAWAYGIQFLKETAIDEARTELVVYGPKENVERFYEDFEDDALEPMENMSIGIDDDDYEAWLNNEVYLCQLIHECDDVFMPKLPVTDIKY